MSVLAQVEGYLFDLLTESLTDDQTRVVFGYAEAPELVAIFTTEFDRDFRLLGPQPVPLEERFQTEIIVEVMFPSGRDMRPAAVRAWEVFDLVDNAIRGDHHLDTLSFDARFEKGSREFFQTDKKQGCRIRATLAGTVRI